MIKDSEPPLKKALKDCAASAGRGYKVAKHHVNELEENIRITGSEISKCLGSHDGTAIRTTELVANLTDQLNVNIAELETLNNIAHATLEENKKRLKTFRITLFGRTLAGKSTLMEILTDGDGSTIGTGKQRTTQDVRVYKWHELEITDVPGIAAFGGQQDEELAFEAAIQADLVIFLITDDGPQPEVARCLSHVKRLGKPTLGICNICMADRDETDLIMTLKQLEPRYSSLDLKQLIKQFNELTNSFGAGRHTYFLFTHLDLQFLAKNPHLVRPMQDRPSLQQRPDFANLKNKMIRLSRFTKIEKRIMQEVSERGSFLRYRSFADNAIAPMLAYSYMLLDFSNLNSKNGRILIGKQRQLKQWTSKFRNDGQAEIQAHVSKVTGALEDEVPIFVEDHYDSDDASNQWGFFVESVSIQKKSEKLMDRLLKTCQIQLQEVARELEAELSLVGRYSADTQVNMDKIFDSKRAWNWGVNILSGGLGVAALILSSGPLGWAAATVGIGGYLLSMLFDDREKKATKARNKLAAKLNKQIDKISQQLRHQLNDWFHQRLLRDQVYKLANDLHSLISALFTLSDSQRTLAWRIVNQISRLNMDLLNEATSDSGTDIKQARARVSKAARIPGYACMFLISAGPRIPVNFKRLIEKRFGETVWFVIDTSDPRSIISQAIGRQVATSDISIDSDLQIAYIPEINLTHTTTNRIKLAQQITNLHVMKHIGGKRHG